MIGKVIGAIAGKRISRDVSGVGGTSGALLGVGAATVLRRLGPVGMVAAAVGGYAFKKHLEKRDADKLR
ncbi:hypothetical protein EDF57_10987 [Novosphingobium sp. PhB55]|uniref:hypothetical protein n=1 Tax=Novosphingobium sp. PhB55 TaxID=2485106 RepID=UPI00106682AD|nr:hypothetical protein [Novosphingobium sp. PhB55]TDW61529.1 hypothetical protein EDF57_10987 [Novosphingobium sp. PhB55]